MHNEDRLIHTHLYCYTDQIKEVGIGWACSTGVSWEIRIKFCLGKMEMGDHMGWGDRRVDGSVILKWMGVRVRTRLHFPLT